MTCVCQWKQTLWDQNSKKATKTIRQETDAFLLPKKKKKSLGDNTTLDDMVEEFFQLFPTIQTGQAKRPGKWLLVFDVSRKTTGWS